MENDILTPNPDYQNGFNEGYLITQHKPQLADELAKIESDMPRLEGMKDGRRQFVLERTRSLRPDWLNQDRQPQNTPDKDKDRETER